MRTPRLTPLMAVLAALSSSSWAAKNPPPAVKAPSPAWQAQEETSLDKWPEVTFVQGKAKKLLHCRLAECSPDKATGVIPLYKFVTVKTEDVRVDLSEIRDFKYLYFFRRTEKIPIVATAKKITYEAQLSNYSYDLAKKEVVQGKVHIKASPRYVDPNIPQIGVHPSNRYVVQPSAKMADDRIAKSPAKTPAGSGPARKKKKKGDTPASTVEQPAPPTLTGKAPATAVEPPPADAAADKELTEDELKELDKTGDRQKYLDNLKAAKDNMKNDPKGVVEVVRKWRAVAEANKKSPAADPDKLLKDFLKTKLSAKDAEEFEKALMATKSPAERDFVMSMYLAKLAPGITDDELKGLAKPLRKSVCGQLKNPITPEVAKAIKSNTDLKNLQNLDVGKTFFDTSAQTGNAGSVVTAGPPLLLSQSKDLGRLDIKCQNLDLTDSKDPEPKKKESAAMAGPSVNDLDPGGPPKKADPNEWLAVKTGVVGMVPGVMVGSFFGPVGILAGAAVGFAVFWGLSKLTN